MQCVHALCSAATSGLESASYAKADALANQMGLFLQKTNIIRDYLVSSGPGLLGARGGDGGAFWE
jgi:hypothetical protein